MSDDGEIEWAKGVARFFRGLYEDAVIADAEDSLASTEAAYGVPMPNTAHPAYASNAAGVREIGADGRWHVRVARPFRPSFAFVEEGATAPLSDEPMRAIVLTRRKCCGPAPFVGDPLWQRAVYVWPTWVDDAGRHVAGDAELVLARLP